VIPANLPDYVERGGRQVWRPPYTARGAKLFGFVLGADAAAIDSLLNHDLNEPAGGAVDYRCAHPKVIVIFAMIDQLASEDPRDEMRGCLCEREVSVWCLAADVTAGSRLVWYLPYVFVDAGQAVASGREVYGYPKQIGFFDDDYPDELDTGGTTTVSAPAIDPYGKTQKATPRAMFTAEPAGGAPAAGGPPAAAGGFADLRELFTAGLGIRDDLPFGPPPRSAGAITPVGAPPPRRARAPSVPAWAGRRVLDTLRGRGQIGSAGDLVAEMIESPTLVFLKQFRDASCATKACYQAIVEAPLAVHLTTARYCPLDPKAYRITVGEWASHPIASDLGLPRSPQVPELAFRAGFDFDIQLGSEVWRAPT
jgi:hypothetical protein